MTVADNLNAHVAGTGLYPRAKYRRRYGFFSPDWRELHRTARDFACYLQRRPGQPTIDTELIALRLVDAFGLFDSKPISLDAIGLTEADLIAEFSRCHYQKAAAILKKRKSGKDKTVPWMIAYLVAFRAAFDDAHPANRHVGWSKEPRKRAPDDFDRDDEQDTEWNTDPEYAAEREQRIKDGLAKIAAGPDRALNQFERRAMNWLAIGFALTRVDPVKVVPNSRGTVLQAKELYESRLFNPRRTRRTS